MNNNDKVLTDFWDVLNLSSDYLTTGTVNKHSHLEISTDSLDKIAKEISICTKCSLCETRTKTVPGSGSREPSLLIIGEGPGAEEDKSGHPFVGKAGQYMDKWMDAIGLVREKDLFLANIVKCRPPGNRDPLNEEISACLPYLERQIKLLKPNLILSVGRISSQILTGSSEGIGRLRSKTYNYKGTALIPTYHPSGVLRNPDEYRKPVWEDLKRVKDFLNDTNSK
ncbi:MAG: uracil-DNA glycosylase [Spirochaetales bacterium]|nr:uracil-DNA glycosylase [Spirochaetales bacterium]